MKQNAKLEDIYKFMKVINDFKSIERLSLIGYANRRESDAEHSWHLTVSVWLVAEIWGKKIDVSKCLKMALTHDLVELYAGDVYAFDASNKREEKEGRERNATLTIKNQLSEGLGNELESLWFEYEDKETEESKLVWAMDKIMPRMQWVLTQGDLTDNLSTDHEKKQYQDTQLRNINPVISNLLDLIKVDLSFINKLEIP